MEYKSVLFRKVLTHPGITWVKGPLKLDFSSGGIVGGQITIGPTPAYDPGELLTQTYGPAGWQIAGLHMNESQDSMIVMLQR